MNTASGISAPVPFDLGSGEQSTPAPAQLPRPRLPWGARVALTMAAMPIAALSGAPLMLAPGFTDLMRSTSVWTSITAMAVLAGFTCAVYLLLSWGLMRGIDRRPFRDLRLAITPRAAVGLAAGMGIALVATVAGTWLVQMLGVARMPEQEFSLGGISVLAAVIGVLIPAFLLQGIGEEVLFRGYLQRSLPQRPATAVLISAAAFGILHLVSQGGQESAIERVYYLALPFGFALCAGFLAHRMGTTWAAIGIHGGSHVATTVAAALGLGGTGPAQWIVVGVLFAAAGLIVHLLPRRVASTKSAA